MFPRIASETRAGLTRLIWAPFFFFFPCWGLKLQGGLAEVLLRLQQWSWHQCCHWLISECASQENIFTEFAHLRPKPENKTRTSYHFINYWIVPRQLSGSERIWLILFGTKTWMMHVQQFSPIHAWKLHWCFHLVMTGHVQWIFTLTKSNPDFGYGGGNLQSHPVCVIQLAGSEAVLLVSLMVHFGGGGGARARFGPHRGFNAVGCCFVLAVLPKWGFAEVTQKSKVAEGCCHLQTEFQQNHR